MTSEKHLVDARLDLYRVLGSARGRTMPSPSDALERYLAQRKLQRTA
jgi:hypothetical protein